MGTTTQKTAWLSNGQLKLGGETIADLTNEASMTEFLSKCTRQGDKVFYDGIYLADLQDLAMANLDTQIAGMQKAAGEKRQLRERLLALPTAQAADASS